jgi:hypothetical protein
VSVRPDLANDFMPKAAPKNGIHSSNTINLQTGQIEDVYEDGTRKVIRKATPQEIARAGHVPNEGRQEPLVQVQQPDGSIEYVPRSQASGMKAPNRAAQGSASLKKAVATNQTNLSVIDDALSELQKYPDAIGLKRGVGDNINQRLDPKGVAARAALMNISSLLIHDRSGAAVTAAEFPRLKPFIPAITDSYAAAKTKLEKLKQAIASESAALGQQLGSEAAPITPGAPPRGGSSGDIDLRNSPTLSSLDRARAKRDPKFAAWLMSQGITP